MRPVLVLAVLTACSVNRTVLEGGVTDCAQALTLGVNGQPCDLDTTCSGSTDCCTTTAYCRDGSLVVDQECNPDCTECGDDTGCTFGAAICTNHRCVPCGEGCPVTTTCPVGWPHLIRNGCEDCACAPPATCHIAAPSCVNGICYRGAVCAAGCDETVPGCCDDQCEPPGCPSPIPTGCLMPSCPANMGSCMTCAASECTCVADQWSCAAICADGLVTSCVAPPFITAPPPVITAPPP